VSLEQFIDILRSADRETYVEDLLDALWLSQQDCNLTLHSSPQSLPLTPGKTKPIDRKKTGETKQKHEPAESDATAPAERAASDRDATAAVYPSGVTDGGPTRKASPVAIPAGKALTNRLQLARALRPFRQRWPSHHEFEIDEPRTVEATADLHGFFYPVIRPLREPWFTVDLILEDDPVIDVWQDVLLDFSQMLRETGAFLDVRNWRLRVGSNARETGQSSSTLEAFAGGHVSTRFVTGSGTRRLIFFATHGSSSQWLDGTYTRILESWVPTCSVVLLHMFPKELWRRTPLGEPSGTCHSQDPGTPSARLTTDTFWWKHPAGSGERQLFVPAVSMNAGDLSEWAHMQMARGRRSPVFALDHQPLDSVHEPSAPTSADLSRIVRLFKSESPDAFRLAVYLSSSAFTLPVARLIQEATFGTAARRSHLADVLLSGMVFAHAKDGPRVDPNTTYYEFYPEAKRRLTRSLQKEKAEAISASLEQHLSRYIEGIQGRPFSFRALIQDENGEYTLPAWAQPFARLGISLLGVPDRSRSTREIFDAFRARVSAPFFNAVRKSILSNHERVLSTGAVNREILDALIAARLVRRNSARQWESIPGVEALFAEAPPSLPEKPSEEDDFALIVGINWYANLPQLGFANDGATRFADWLTRQGHAIPTDQIRILVSNDAATAVSAQALRDAFGEIAEAARRKRTGRRFYFYFSGHYCLSATTGGEPLLLTSEASAHIQSSIAIRQYLQWLASIPTFEEIVCVVDGPTTTFPSLVAEPVPFVTAERSNKPASLLFLREEFAYGPRSQTSSLTRLLIEGLGGAAAAPSGDITSASLLSFLDQRMGINRVILERLGAEVVLVTNAEHRDQLPTEFPNSVIITSLAVERDAAQMHLRDVRSVRQSGLEFSVGTLNYNGRTQEIAILPVSNSPQNLASTIDQAFHLGARTFISLGLASGLRDVRLGDVVFADRALELLGSRPNREYSVAVPSIALLESAKSASQETRWLSILRAEEGDRSLRAHMGTIASGRTVGSAPETPPGDSRLLAFDLTAFQFLNIIGHKTGAAGLVVRGISDLGGREKAEFGENAARHAAAFCVAVLEKLSEQVIGDDADPTADEYFKRGNSLAARKKYDEAIVEYQRGIQLDPSRAQTHNSLGNVFRVQRKNEQAIEQFRRAIVLDPMYSAAHRNLGLVLSAQKNYDEAIAHFQNAISLDSQYSPTYKNLAVALSAQKRHDEAISLYRQAIRLDPNDASSLKNLGTALARQHRFEEAIAEYQKAIRLNPRYASAFKNLGDVLFSLRRYPEAIEQYRKTIILDPNYASAHSNWGAALSDLQRYDEAIEHYKRALEINPRAIRAQIGLAWAFYYTGKPKDAAQTAELTLQNAPRNVQANMLLGHALIQLGETQKALESYRKVTQLDPSNVANYNSIGLILESVRAFDEAIEFLKKAVDIDPTFADTYRNLSRVLRSVGRLDEATALERQTSAPDPSLNDKAQPIHLWLKLAGFEHLAYLSCARSAIEQENRLVVDFVAELNSVLYEQQLVDQGIFFDRSHLHLGQPIFGRIQEALKKSACMLAIVTPAYLSSTFARQELETFEMEFRKKLPTGNPPLLPIVLDRSTRLPGPWGKIRALDFSALAVNPNYKQTVEFREAVRGVARTLIVMTRTLVVPDTRIEGRADNYQAVSDQEFTYRPAAELKRYPLPQKHADDIQKSRWGGRHAADGRRLSATVVKHGYEDYEVALRLSSTDGSRLHGPVRFHLHDSFPRSPITIQKCEPDAVLDELKAWDSFTVGVEVPRIDSERTVLELDLEKAFKDADKAYKPKTKARRTRKARKRK
jgi:tetratricopeptide (TPR) repeat protein